MIRIRKFLLIGLIASLVSVGAALSIAPAFAQDAGSFTIGYEDTVSDGVPEPGAGNIETAGEVDVYDFEGSAGDVAIFDVLAGRGGDFRWALVAPGGTALFDGLYVDRDAALPETGTYTLSVRAATATFVGTYSFSLLLTPPGQQFTIGFGDTVSDGVPAPGAGNVEVPGAVDSYLFDGTAGQVAILDALTRSNNVGWRLLAPDGSTVFQSLYVDRQVDIDQTGTYTLIVSGLSITSAGVYSFQLLDVPPRVDEFTIVYGDTVSDGVPAAGAGNLEGPGATDRYLFAGAPGDVAIFETLAGNTTEVRWRLEAPDGSPVFDSLYVDQQAALAQSGTYVLTVSGLTVTSFGTYSFQLRQAPPNAAPIAAADVVETEYGEPVTIDVLANDSDPDGDDLVIDSVGQPDHGSVVTSGAQITYSPDAGFAGTDTFTYRVADGRGGTADAIVTVTVHEPPNAPPSVVGIDDQDNLVGDQIALAVQASDPDGDALTYAADGLPPGLGIGADTGEITGIIDQGAEVGSPYSVRVSVADGDGATATASFQWTVRPAAKDPVTVEVDVLAWCIVNDGHGVIPVVIYGNPSAPANRIDPATVMLEGMPVARVFRWYAAVAYDVNRDGIKDLVVLIDDVAAAIPTGATTATITGQLDDGTAIEGTDKICLYQR